MSNATTNNGDDTMANEININKSESLNTTEEIILAINEISGDIRTAMQIWDAPTDSEFKNVIARADELLNHDCGEITWGCSTITINIDACQTDFSGRYDF